MRRTAKPAGGGSGPTKADGTTGARSGAGGGAVATAPLRKDGEREIRTGDYLRIDGLFHAIYRTPLEFDTGSNISAISSVMSTCSSR